MAILFFSSSTCLPWVEKVNAAREATGLERLPNMQQELDAQLAR